MSYVIEDGIELPGSRTRGKGGRDRSCKTPWTQILDSLLPGQSVLCGEYREYRAAEQFKPRRPERKFAIRKIPNEGWRVWRTE
jgi:hypothetical protein